MHLMWQSQFFTRYFGVFLLPCMFVGHLGVCGNFVENYYNGPSKQLNRVQYIRGGISPWKAFRLFPTPKTLVGKSQQSLTSHSYLLGNLGSWIRTRIQYLSIWTLASPRPSTYEFWTFAPTEYKSIIFSLPSWKTVVITYSFSSIVSLC